MFNYYSRLAHVLNVERYCIRIRMCFSAMKNLARSIHMLDRGRPAGAAHAAQVEQH